MIMIIKTTTTARVDNRIFYTLFYIYLHKLSIRAKTKSMPKAVEK